MHDGMNLNATQKLKILKIMYYIDNYDIAEMLGYTRGHVDNLMSQQRVVDLDVELVEKKLLERAKKKA
jgi:CRP-like cAMP-binding protein